MGPRLRNLVLTAHVASSVGLLGAVASFLALAVAGLASTDGEVVSASYIAMRVVAWFVVVPLTMASLVIGVVQSLGTTWGLFRYYWVLAKLVLTVVVMIVLLLQMGLIDGLASAAGTVLSAGDLREARMALVVHSGGGLLVLLLPVVLSVYKPRGKTGYGRRKEQDRRVILAP